MFWDCRVVRWASGFAIGIVNSMKAISNQKGPWETLLWYNGVLGKIPASQMILPSTTPDGMLVRSSKWFFSKWFAKVFLTLLELHEMKLPKTPRGRLFVMVSFAKFDSTWGGINLLYQRSNSRILWNNQAPNGLWNTSVFHPSLGTLLWIL